jgi:DNA polymerase-4
MWMLAESVAERLRGHMLKCNGVQISMRDKNLLGCQRQGQLEFSTYVSNHIAVRALEIFKEKYQFGTPLRSIGVRAINLVAAIKPQQMSLFIDHQQIEKLEKIEHAVDNIRQRFGYHAVQKGVIFMDKNLTGLHPQNDQHLIHPVNYFDGKIF